MQAIPVGAGMLAVSRPEYKKGAAEFFGRVFYLVGDGFPAPSFLLTQGGRLKR
jgi:hypothetical protein